MIIWVYGQQKSASSFCFQLVSDILEAGGFPQDERRKHYLDLVGSKMSTGLNMANTETIEKLLGAMEGDTAPMALKTHGNLTPRIKRMLREGGALGFATFREPRDAALSLYEHGERNREAGKSGGFAEKDTLAAALEHMAKALPRIETWASHPKIQPLSFETLSEKPVRAARKIAKHLKIEAPVEAIVAAYRSGEKKIGNLNVGTPDRFAEIASDADRALADRLFADFTLPSEDRKGRKNSWENAKAATSDAG
jgi:hypothetical protein